MNLDCLGGNPLIPSRWNPAHYDWTIVYVQYLHITGCTMEGLHQHARSCCAVTNNEWRIIIIRDWPVPRSWQISHTWHSLGWSSPHTPSHSPLPLSPHPPSQTPAHLQYYQNNTIYTVRVGLAIHYTFSNTCTPAILSDQHNIHSKCRAGNTVYHLHT